MGESGNRDPRQQAIVGLRRFLRARWEEGDPTLFRMAVKARPKPAGRPAPPIDPAAPPTSSAPVSGILNPEASDQGNALAGLFDRIHTCMKCPLGKTRTKFVFGTGDGRAEVMFVGEAPGQQEDESGIPFVGLAGQLLTRLIEAAGIKRSTVFIANVLKCRPPSNRPPLPEEIEQCEPYLVEQIGIIKPRVIVALGTSAAQTLLRTDLTIGKIRGKWSTLHGAEFFATYHPSAGLRSGDFKKVIEDDLQTLKARLATLPARG